MDWHGDGHGKRQLNITTNETLSITTIQCIWSMQTIFMKLDQEGGIKKNVLQNFMLFVADGHIHLVLHLHIVPNF